MGLWTKKGSDGGNTKTMSQGRDHRPRGCRSSGSHLAGHMKYSEGPSRPSGVFTDFGGLQLLGNPTMSGLRMRQSQLKDLRVKMGGKKYPQ